MYRIIVAIFFCSCLATVSGRWSRGLSASEVTSAALRFERHHQRLHEAGRFQGKLATHRNIVAHLNGTGSDVSKSDYLAMPSICRLDNGNLLAVYETEMRNPYLSGSKRLASVSEDGGETWELAAEVQGPMHWPQLVKTKAGVFIIGSQRQFSEDNNLVVVKMLGENGDRWSWPNQITWGLSVVTANTGVEVSNGRVVKTFEMVPQKSQSWARSNTELTKDLTVNLVPTSASEDDGSLPTLIASVLSTDRFVVGTMVACTDKVTGGLPVHFRVMSVDESKSEIHLRPEMFDTIIASGERLLSAGSMLRTLSGGFVYGGVDWTSMAITAPDDADLTDVFAWNISNAVGNPASIHVQGMSRLLDVSFRADAPARKSALGDEVPQEVLDELDKIPESKLRAAGFGSVYMMEGTPVRLRDRHGGDGSIQVLMRINNDNQCSLGALVSYREAEVEGHPGMQLRGEFLRYVFAPGMAVAHPAIIYDSESDLYWYVNNVVRDGMRRWSKEWAEGLHVTPRSLCEVDRTSIGLFYSRNALDWHSAGLIDYSNSLRNHFTYPHMIVDHHDLLVVTRAALGKDEKYNNHYSNSIVMHRIRNFRTLANHDWLRLEEEAALPVLPRRVKEEGVSDFLV